MIPTLRLRAGESKVAVWIAPGLLDQLGERLRDVATGSRVVVIIDRTVDGLYGTRIRRSLRSGHWSIAAWEAVPPGERSKNLARAQRMYRNLMDAGVDRWTPVLAIGGGVTGDLGGYVASTFLRGLPLIHVPTSVVAQVDSSIGGKTAVNLGGGKNLVGTFYQAAAVLTDPSVLQTMNERDFRAGLAEAVKIGVTLRPDLMQRLEAEGDRVLSRDPEVLAHVVSACVEAKGEVVGRDEREQDVRAILNYGHTVGHALESLSLGRLRHGEAVAVGMEAAAWLGSRIGVAHPEVQTRQHELLLRLGLPTTYSGADARSVARKLRLDKKIRERRIRFVLTLQIGGASVWPHIPNGLLAEAIRQVTC